MRACVGEVLGMVWQRVGHASAMCRECFSDVFGMVWGYFGDAFGSIWGVNGNGPPELAWAALFSRTLIAVAFAATLIFRAMFAETPHHGAIRSLKLHVYSLFRRSLEMKW